uniref:Insulin-induced gene protein n=1 Tax=Cyprinus carpio TaxID=7962 RepID=A0A8C1SPV5_CYPCA
MAEDSSLSGGAPMHRGPYISMITNRTMNLLIRAAMLFMVGVFLALVLNLLQVQRNVTLFPPDAISSIFSSAWWLPPCCGTAAALIGLLYPCMDRRLGEPHKLKREWSNVMRCVAVFVGINHASAVSFSNKVILSSGSAAINYRCLCLIVYILKSPCNIGKKKLQLGITDVFYVHQQPTLFQAFKQKRIQKPNDIRTMLPCFWVLAYKNASSLLHSIV